MDASNNPLSMNRRALLRSGLLAGAGAVTLGASALSSSGVAQATTAGIQYGWAWCKWCDLLFFADSKYLACPYIGKTHSVGTVDYYLNHDQPAQAGLQPKWSWCFNCGVIFYGPKVTDSACPGSTNVPPYDTHAAGSNWSYDIWENTGSGQSGWNWCNKCQGLFWGNRQQAGVCWKNGSHYPGGGVDAVDYRVGHE